MYGIPFLKKEKKKSYHLTVGIKNDQSPQKKKKRRKYLISLEIVKLMCQLVLHPKGWIKENLYIGKDLYSLYDWSRSKPWNNGIINYNLCIKADPKRSKVLR